jgi:hypothetical protein
VGGVSPPHMPRVALKRDTIETVKIIATNASVTRFVIVVEAQDHSDDRFRDDVGDCG